ncbi:unnamed protein product [Brachionus calyciflorus]|uniref:C1q domain-containing protein n=1 Tax=Brachionus calyciflorus TaxID=104777 RepID=A0A813TH79_9BILA|nr:unnamed protein product [Brachionus calyciflorus]
MYLEAQSDTFRYLEEWANENKNYAIQDIAKEINTLTSKIKQISSQSNPVIKMLKNFQEYDNQLKKNRRQSSIVKKSIESHSKNENLEKEIDASISILFKSNMKLYSKSFTRDIVLQNTLHVAIDEMVDQLPDVSAEDVDDISDIEYNSRGKIQRISERAKKRMNNTQFDENVYQEKLFPSIEIFNDNSPNKSLPPPYSEFFRSLKKQYHPSPPSTVKFSNK